MASKTATKTKGKTDRFTIVGYRAAIGAVGVRSQFGHRFAWNDRSDVRIEGKTYRAGTLGTCIRCGARIERDAPNSNSARFDISHASRPCVSSDAKPKAAQPAKPKAKPKAAKPRKAAAAPAERAETDAIADMAATEATEAPAFA